MARFAPLAAAAIAVVLATTVGWWLRRPPSALAELIAATTRPELIRLSGFPPAAARPADRGEEAESDWRLLAAAGRAQEEAKSNPSPSNLHTLGIAHLLVGKLPEAVEILREVRRGHANARLDNDLGAALVQEGIQDHEPRYVAEGLEILLRVRSASPLPEASFNEAVALEALGLREQALVAWEHLLRLDPHSQWAQETSTRMHRLGDQGRRLTSAVDLEREVFEQLLRQWAAATVEGRQRDALESLGQAARRAKAHASATLDPLLMDAVAAIRRATAAQLSVLAQGHLAYASARQDYLVQDLAGCRQQSSKAADFLASGDTPVASLALLTRASCDFLANDLDLARRHAGAAAKLASQQTHSSALIIGQNNWLRGLVAHAENRPIESLGFYRQALGAFAQARDPHRQAAVHALLAGLFDYLGRVDEAWAEAVQAVRPDDPSPRRRYQALWGLAELARREGFPHVARQIARAMQADARATGLGDYLADAHLVLGRAERESGASQAAARSFEHAVDAAGTISDPAARQRASAHAAVELARSVLHDEPARVTALLHAVEPFERTDGELYLAAAQVRSLAFLLQGNPREAEAVLRTATGRSTSERASLGSLHDRDALLGRRTEVYHMLVRLLVEQGRPAEALDVLEGWRSEPFERSLAATDAGVSQHIEMDDSTVLFTYLCLGDELLVWRIDSAGIDLTRRPVGRDLLAELVATAREEVRLGKVKAPASRQLERLLFGEAPFSQARRLVIVPDEVLFSVPFGALPGAGREPLLARYQVSVSPSVYLWVALAAKPPRPPHCAWLIAGSPSGGALYPRLKPLQRLDDELRGVGMLYSCSVEASTVEDVRSSSRDGYTVVHYAGHSIPGGASGGALLLPAGDEVGTLAASEIERWSLNGATVVLSSCSAAEGRRSIIAGRDGLARAFLSAGARSVVANLWPVQDEHAMGFALALHRQLASGAEAAAALRGAQLELIAKGRPAAAWAGWVVIGAG